MLYIMKYDLGHIRYGLPATTVNDYLLFFNGLGRPFPMEALF